MMSNLCRISLPYVAICSADIGFETDTWYKMVLLRRELRTIPINRFLYSEALYIASLTNAQSYMTYQLKAAAFITSSFMKLLHSLGRGIPSSLFKILATRVLHIFLVALWLDFTYQIIRHRIWKHPCLFWSARCLPYSWDSIIIIWVFYIVRVSKRL